MKEYGSAKENNWSEEGPLGSEQLLYEFEAVDELLLFA